MNLKVMRVSSRVSPTFWLLAWFWTLSTKIGQIFAAHHAFYARIELPSPRNTPRERPPHKSRSQLQDKRLIMRRTWCRGPCRVSPTEKQRPREILLSSSKVCNQYSHKMPKRLTHTTSPFSASVSPTVRHRKLDHESEPGTRKLLQCMKNGHA